MAPHLPVDADLPAGSLLKSVQDWVANGSRVTAGSNPSTWYLLKARRSFMQCYRPALVLAGHFKSRAAIMSFPKLVLSGCGKGGIVV
jgi:hypothetical protein